MCIENKMEKRKNIWQLPSYQEFAIATVIAIVLFSVLCFGIFSACTASFSLQKQNENSSVTIKTESTNKADSTSVTFQNN